jgi:hypothetical protein
LQSHSVIAAPLQPPAHLAWRPYVTVRAELAGEGPMASTVIASVPSNAGTPIGRTDIRATADLGVAGHRALGLVVLGDRGLADAGRVHQLGHFRANGVVLVRRDGDGGQDADDRNDDHQFDKGEALLDFLHENSLVGVWVSHGCCRCAALLMQSACHGGCVFPSPQGGRGESTFH